MKNLTKTLILLSCFLGGSLPAFSNDFFIPKSMFLDEFPYPFTPQPIDIPDLVLNTMQNLDILFLGETHDQSIFLLENYYNQKVKYNSHRVNSLNQENIYFHFIDRFSKIHEKAKKCLWIEYDFNDPYIEVVLNGLNYYTSHYYLINTAIEQGWTVFPVDNHSFVDIDNNDFATDLRNQFMSEQIAKTISNGDCEKGIAQNGIAHLSGYKTYVNKHNLKDRSIKDEFVNELLKIQLNNLSLNKRIGFFIMENWSEIQILRTREDVLKAYKAGQRDFSGWNLSRVKLIRALLAKANLSEVYLREANLRGANLYKANLQGADLLGALLTRANLRETDLRETDLRGTDLRKANLQEANLRRADLQEADLRWANFYETDLRGAKYNSQTLFPDNFDPKSQGMVFMPELMSKQTSIKTKKQE